MARRQPGHGLAEPLEPHRGSHHLGRVGAGSKMPKSVSAADKAALLLAPPLVLVGKVVRPVIVALNWAANHIVRWFRIEPKDEVSSSFTLEEVQSIVEESPQRPGR